MKRVVALLLTALLGAAINLLVRKEFTEHIRYADQYPISAFNSEQSVDKAKIANVPHEEEMVVSRTVNEPLPDLPEHLLLGIEPGQHIMGMDINVLGLLFFSGFADVFYTLDDAGFHLSIGQFKINGDGVYQLLIVAEAFDLVQFSARQARSVAGAVRAAHLAVPNAETGVGMMDRAVRLYLYDAAFFNIHDPHDIIAFAEGFEDRTYLRGGILL